MVAMSKKPYPQGLSQALRDEASNQTHMDAADKIDELESTVEKLRARLQMVMRYAAPEVFTKEYDGDSICDLNRDLSEALDPRFNPEAQQIQTDEYNMITGSILVTMQYNPDS